MKVHLADGKDSDTALRDFFQPVVDEIRAAGFKGIIWVPGAGYQSQYQNYENYPIVDSEDNFSYAVHVYSGWYGASDKQCDHEAFIRQFQKQVPMVTSKPIMVTEIDWSPEDPDKPYPAPGTQMMPFSGRSLTWAVGQQPLPRNGDLPGKRYTIILAISV